MLVLCISTVALFGTMYFARYIFMITSFVYQRVVTPRAEIYICETSFDWHGGGKSLKTQNYLLTTGRKRHPQLARGYTLFAPRNEPLTFFCRFILK